MMVYSGPTAANTKLCTHTQPAVHSVAGIVMTWLAAIMVMVPHLGVVSATARGRQLQMSSCSNMDSSDGELEFPTWKGTAIISHGFREDKFPIAEHVVVAVSDHHGML